MFARIVLEATLSQPFAYSRAWYTKRHSLIVEIKTDQGLTGWGECYGPARINASVVREPGALLTGQDALAMEFIWHDLHARFRDHGQKGSIVRWYNLACRSNMKTVSFMCRADQAWGSR